MNVSTYFEKYVFMKQIQIYISRYPLSTLGMDGLPYSNGSLVSAYSTLIMFQVLKPIFLFFLFFVNFHPRIYIFFH